jgi:hypothetical protein
MRRIDDGARIVTRHELAEAMRPALTGKDVSREQLLNVARANGARNDAIEVLSLLPRGSYADLRQVWTSLRQVRTA